MHIFNHLHLYIPEDNHLRACWWAFIFGCTSLPISAPAPVSHPTHGTP
uniref:Uncharacterized protein n=1 Tax=Rhizophora mucronata TaxID=61149 RepID=A0A2P2R4G5_RHIMU